ncbi:MAG: acetyl-CoA carboxylase biotin carboxyl carrier protein [Spirochaetes bacterium]|nr:acetyl-CoA carboxylase biotin carboxyl carrier protein [Spirochaetota bacterium]
MKGLDLTKIFDSMKQNEISELVIKEGSRIYEIRRGGFKHKVITENIPVIQPSYHPMHNIPQTIHPSVQHNQPISNSVNDASAAESKKEESGKSNLYEIKCPLVGTFYTAPKPDAPPFVEIGAKVRKGQTLCIIEAMKNFNEIECEVDGIIRDICVKNADLVEFGKVIFKIELQ